MYVSVFSAALKVVRKRLVS